MPLGLKEWVLLGFLQRGAGRGEACWALPGSLPISKALAKPLRVPCVFNHKSARTQTTSPFAGERAEVLTGLVARSWAVLMWSWWSLFASTSVSLSPTPNAESSGPGECPTAGSTHSLPLPRPPLPLPIPTLYLELPWGFAPNPYLLEPPS